MDGFLKQSTAVTIKIGPFVDKTDGDTDETALTISQADVRLSKNGGNMAQKNEATSCTHDEIGYYDCPLDTTDTGTLGLLKVMVHESGALHAEHNFMVVPANVYESLVGGTDALNINVAYWLGYGVQAHTNGYPAVTIKDGTGTGEIDTASGKVLLQDSAITAAVIADDALDLAALADDALDGITAAVWDSLRSEHATSNTFGATTEWVSGEPNLSAADIRDAVGLAEANLDAQIALLPLASDITTAASIVDAVWDEALAGHVAAGSAGEALGGATTDVTLAATQGAVTFGQVKVLANVTGEGALHIVNAHADGEGLHAESGWGIVAEGSYAGQYNTADGVNSIGLKNESTGLNGVGQYNAGLSAGGVGMTNSGSTYGLENTAISDDEVSPMWATPGADGDTLKTLSDQLDLAALETTAQGLSTLTAQQVWEYVTRELTSAGEGGATAQEVWEYATRALTDKAGFSLHADYDAAKTAASQTSVNDVPTNSELATALASADDAVLAALADLPTNAELAAALGTADDATLAAISALNNLSQAQAQTAATAALNAYDPPTKAELDAGFAAGDDAVLAAIAALNNLSSAGAQAAAAAALTAYGAATSAGIPSVTQIADAVLIRGISHVEDDADPTSLAALVLGAMKSEVIGTAWTIYKTDGSTIFVAKTVATSAAAEAITSVT